MTILSALTAGSPRLASTLWLSANLIVPWIPVRKLGVRSRRVACVLVPGLEDGATLCGHSCQPRPDKTLDVEILGSESAPHPVEGRHHGAALSRWRKDRLGRGGLALHRGVALTTGSLAIANRP